LEGVGTPWALVNVNRRADHNKGDFQSPYAHKIGTCRLQMAGLGGILLEPVPYRPGKEGRLRQERFYNGIMKGVSGQYSQMGTVKIPRTEKGINIALNLEGAGFLAAEGPQ